MPSSDKALISAKVPKPVKDDFVSVASARGLSESALLREVILTVLAEAGHQFNSEPVAPGRRGPKERTTFRYRPGDGPALERRAKARGLPPATYLSMLIHAHVRDAAPMPPEEVRALKACVSELSAVGRNLNQIARGINAGQQEGSEPLSKHLDEVRQQLGDLRAHVAQIVRANLMSWEGGNA